MNGSPSLPASKVYRLPSAISLGVSHLILETDAQDAVQGIKTDNLLDSVVGHLLAEIKSLVRLNLLTFECVFGGRTGNAVTHELARLGSLCTEGYFLMGLMYWLLRIC